MKGQVLIRAAALAVACAAAPRCCGQDARAGEGATVAVSAKVSLSDGSQLIGTPHASSFVLVTGFGKHDIPVAQIASLDFTKDGVKVGFYNKDVLSGKPVGDLFEIQAAFGDVRLSHTQITSVRFSRRRDLSRAAGEPDLLLYAPLDTEEADLALFNARMDVRGARIVDGKSGNAMLLGSPDARATIHLPFSPYAMPEGTIEFWAKLPQPNQKFSSGKGQPWFFSIESAKSSFDCNFVFGFTANDSTGKGGLVGRIYGVAMTGTHYAGSVSNVAETGLLRDSPDGWHHYSIIWKRDGVDFPDARGKSLVLTVDGRIVAVANRGNTGDARQAEAETARFVIHDGNSDCTRPIAMSDLKIWGSAKLPETK